MQKIKQLIQTFTLKKHFFILFFAILLSVLICYFIQISNTEVIEKFSIKIASLSAFLGVLIIYGIYFITLFLDKKIPWKNQIGNRLFLGLLSHFSFAYLLFYFSFFLYNKYNHFDISLNITYHYVLIKIAIIFFILILIYEVIYFALYSYYSYATLQIETVKQERKQIELQLNALKSQLSPHFLFNSLNTISSLAFKNKNKAERFIRRLANMYDYTLKSYNSKLISLSEELSFVNSYLFLLETRFENKFKCTITISENLLESKIPPLTLQMLIENAVKHNQLSKKTPLEISITTDENYITIQNNLTEKQEKITSFNIGLKNINSRYFLLSNKGIIVINNNSFTVKIPILR